MSIISYIIADDHKIFRQGLKMTLQDDPRLDCVAEASNGIELLSLLRVKKPNIILLDLKMPEMDGLRVLKIIKEQYPKIKVLILTMFDDEHFIVNMMESGANGYLLKDVESEEIKTAIHTICKHDYYFNDLVNNTLLRKILKQKNTLGFKEAIMLSDRESEILQLICQEYTTAEISKKISLSTRTVEGLRAALLEKIGVRNTAGLVMYALKSGLII